LAADTSELRSGGGGGCVRTGAAVNGSPSTDFPQRHSSAGGRTRRPHAGHTRLSPAGWTSAIYEKILT
jgi:hypothetical protein